MRHGFCRDIGKGWGARAYWHLSLNKQLVVYKINKLDQGLDLTQDTIISDRSLTVCENMFYNAANQLQTRRGYSTFGDMIWSSPFTSYFFRQNDKSGERIAIWFAGTDMWRYDEGSDARDSIHDELQEFETRPWFTTQRTKRDFAVYKNVCYMCDWVNPYMSYDWTTVTIIGTSTITCTFDNTTDIVTSVGHGLATDDEISFTSTWDVPTGLTEGLVYYVIKINNDTFNLTLTPGGAGDVVDFSSNGTGTITGTKYSQPRVRFLEYMQDSIFGAWEYSNPNTLYYTNSLPADGTTISSNAVGIGWDENWVINSIKEFNKLIVVYKTYSAYTFNVADPTVDKIDSWTWGFGNRTVIPVKDNIYYRSQLWIDSLRKRQGVDTIEPWFIGEKVQTLTNTVDELYYNTAASHHIHSINNYYTTFDTSWDGRPDTTLVYNTKTWGFTQYLFPNIYAYWIYITSTWETRNIFTSASWGQAYRMEYGFDDDGVTIDSVVETGNYDMQQPWEVKTSRYVTVTWYKQEWGEVDVTVYCDDRSAGVGSVTDDNLDLSNPSWALWVTPLWVDPLWVGADEWSLPMYRFTKRIQFFDRFFLLRLLFEANTQWILEKIEIDAWGTSVDTLPFSTIS